MNVFFLQCLNCFKLKEECKNRKQLDVMEMSPGIQIEYIAQRGCHADGEIVALAGEAHNSSGETNALTLYIKWNDPQNFYSCYGVHLPATIDVKADNTQFLYRCT